MIPQTSLRTLLAATGVVLALNGIALPPSPARAADPVATGTEAGILPVQLKTGKGTFVPLAGEASAVFVADPEIADVEIKFANMLYVYGKAPGQTTVHVLDANGGILISRTVQVVANVQELQAALREVLPDIDIQASPVNKKIILKGTVRSPDVADTAMQLARGYVEDDADLINMIQVHESNQITLRVRVAEVQRSLTKQFGIDWQTGGVRTTGSARNNAQGLGRSPGAFFTPEDTATGARSFSYGVLNSWDFTDFGDVYNIGAGIATGNFNLDGVLSALEQEGLITLLAEPNLTAVSGESASFLAGGEFPILYVDNDDTVIEYRQFGVSLNFTPFLLSENRIRLKVKPEVSELSNQGSVEINGYTIPALTTRRAETTVELGNGETFSIAGIFQNRMRDAVTKFPWLGDLPVLGTMFRSQDFVHDNSELLILATPYVVEPINNIKDIKTPVADARIPSDVNWVLYGQNVQSPLRPVTIKGVGTESLVGPIGFSLD
jgi:pilus assembly protein CpaC